VGSLFAVSFSGGCLEDTVKQRVRPTGPRFKFGVKLAGHKVRVVGYLNDFNEVFIG